ncbi:site-2 protease family protein [Gracilibacillus salinarum]|uniref:Site-2 protease family protein n=1 Tax=Gracilibacillus salinarum TaxID=2932255 RepID=A0ABY4GPL3_9BACI|nr:site-2 protease family protein [Gracilibacillus salinarum]UOQ86151.1 site-2 protease family protein [Gracilibacillus salinarum]
MSSRNLPPVRIHPILYFFLFIAILTGMLVEFAIIFLIVFLHELGHYTCARIFNWRIQRIFLWVFGGVMETDEYGTRPLKEEWLVTIAGPVMHLFIYLFLFLLELGNALPDTTLIMAYQYNSFILIGNLLPIWPLDGGKLTQLSLDTFCSYQLSHKWMIVISVSTIVITSLFVYAREWLSLSFVLLIVFLIWENRLEWKRRYYKWWRFLWNRYTMQEHYRKQIEIDVPTNLRLLDLFRLFKRDTTYHIRVFDSVGNVYIVSEKDCLRDFFDRRDITASLGQMRSG